MYSLAERPQLKSLRRARSVICATCSPFDQDRPVVFIGIRAKGSADGVQHVVRVVCLEGEPIAEAVSAVLNGILEAAGFPHHRHRAIAAGDHLGQPAGLAL